MSKLPYLLYASLLLLALMTLPISEAQPTNHWFKTYGSTIKDYLMDPIAIGNYIYAVGYTGYITSGGAWEYDILVAKFNYVDGGAEWIYRVQDSVANEGYTYRFFHLVRGDDGYIYAAGQGQYPYGPGLYDRMVAGKIDPNSGSFIWFRCYYINAGNDYRGFVVRYYNGYLYLIGRSEYPSSSESQLTIIKLDPSTGDVVGDSYIYEYGDTTAESQRAVIINGYIYVIGYLTTGAYDAFLAKIDLNTMGLVWYKVLGSASLYDLGASMTKDDDGYIYIVGTTETYSAGGGRDAYVAKIDPSTDSVVWFRAFGGSGDEYGFDVMYGPDGYLYVVGRTSSFGAGDFDGFIAKLSTDGDLLSFVTVGGASKDSFSGLVVANGYMYITGFTTSYGEGNEDAVLMLYSPAISDQLNWVGGEGWDPVYVSDYTSDVSVGAFTPTFNDVSVNTHTPTFNADDRTDYLEVTEWSPGIHTATDSETPIPIPELIATGLAALAIALVALYLVRRRLVTS
ncbi:MAG TPA: hypothetical protein ENF75_01255 [Acidilobales archaeon]|nr:hypothetical protein [Acidilobales archaeon]